MMSEKIWTIGEILEWTNQYFQNHKIESPRPDAEILLAHVLKKDRLHLYVEFDKPLQKNELAQFKQLILQRSKHVPIAYILGNKEFYGRTFKVSPDTLIPRPDTEILIEKVLASIPQLPNELSGDNLHILDLGTGTGAIILTILAEYPQAIGTAVDISSNALTIAQENASLLELTHRCEFIKSDLFTGLRSRKYSVIVSNPPYIPQNEMSSLSTDVRDYEPHSALTDYGDGLEFYRKILSQGQDYLLPGGMLGLEIGIHQASDVAKLAREHGWININISKDYAGIERVVIAWKQE